MYWYSNRNGFSNFQAYLMTQQKGKLGSLLAAPVLVLVLELVLVPVASSAEVLEAVPADSPAMKVAVNLAPHCRSFVRLLADLSFAGLPQVAGC